jgi:Uma2 family endonuclease
MAARRVVTAAGPKDANGVVYPEGDGKPMAETGIHFEEMVRLALVLRARFAGDEMTHVAGNQFYYWEEGNPRAVLAPDIYIAKGVPREPPLRTYKLWELGVAPAVIFELTSASTRREDLGRKKRVYAETGVREYILYDPLAEYLRPPLQGFRLVDSAYEPLAVQADGALISDELDARLMLIDGRLQLFDRRTGERLLDPREQLSINDARVIAEVEARRLAESRARRLGAARRQAEVRAREAEARAAAEAEARRALEAELAALRARLGGGEPPPAT